MSIGLTETVIELPLMPLRNQLLFPGLTAVLELGRAESIQVIDGSLSAGQRIVLALQRDANVAEPGPQDIFEVGTVAEIRNVARLPGGVTQAIFEGISRVRIIHYVAEKPLLRVAAFMYGQDQAPSAETQAMVQTVKDLYERYAKATKKAPLGAVSAVVEVREPGKLADIIAAQAPGIGVDQQYAVLAQFDLSRRLEYVRQVLTGGLDALALEHKIMVQTRETMEKSQRDIFLRAQIQAIQKELGNGDDDETEAERLRARLTAVNPPEELAEQGLREIAHLEKLPRTSVEAVVARGYVDWILALPWSQRTEDKLDLRRAEQILESEHFGLSNPKQRILEHLAVRKLVAHMNGRVLCFVGPPGVGKTSLAKSVAKALDREFVGISMWGIRDEAEIRGNRRAYIGAMPGRVIQSLRQAGTMNPVILLDEIDKMPTNFHGDPMAALAELLDPARNASFADHYLEHAFDLSQVLFITTANSLNGISRPLMERMEVINLSGYTEDEKVVIARRYLLPKQRSAHGLTPESFKISDEAVRRTVRRYTREAGVRNLERMIANLCRKCAWRIARGDGASLRIDVRNLPHHLGMPHPTRSTKPQDDQVGVAISMVYTEVGGELMTVEVSVHRGRGQLMLTGKLGDVMRESAHAGLTYLRSRAEALGITEDFYIKNDIHIHSPEGAIPKEGPSAGVTIATAVVSALTGRPIKANMAMTGEITLRGRVLAIGGVREKVLAAHRAGITEIVLPSGNQDDLASVPQNIRRQLTIHLVEHMDQILRLALTEPLRTPESVGDL